MRTSAGSRNTADAIQAPPANGEAAARATSGETGDSADGGNGTRRSATNPHKEIIFTRSR